MQTRSRRQTAVPAICFTFGLLFPIDVLGAVDPLILDLCRYALAIIIVLLLNLKTEKKSQTAFLAAVLLVFVNSLIAIRAIVSDNTSYLYTSLTGIVSIVFAYQVTRHALANSYILAGLLTGATLSALDIILQVLGLPYLGSESEWGVRYAGLGSGSTNTAPFLALGLVLVLSNFLWRRSILALVLRLTTGLILVIGLLLSGGRGGLAGFLLALSVWLVLQFRFRPLLVLTLCSFGLTVIITRSGDIIDFLMREDSSWGFTSGRDALNEMAWRAMMGGGALGIDLGERANHNPHTPILSFGLSAGVTGFVVAILLTGIIFWRLFNTLPEDRTSSALLQMMAAVLLVTTLLEPHGFFVGLGKGVILMMLFSRNIGSQNDSPSRAEAHKLSHDQENSSPLSAAP